MITRSFETIVPANLRDAVVFLDGNGDKRPGHIVGLCAPDGAAIYDIIDRERSVHNGITASRVVEMTARRAWGAIPAGAPTSEHAFGMPSDEPVAATPAGPATH